MTTITLTINEERQPVGLTDKDDRAWRRFKKMVKDGEPGEILSVDFWFPRNGKFHRLHMAMMAQLFAQQEQFEDANAFRKWVEVGAGYFDLLPGPNGKMMPFHKSISYRALDDEGMREVHEGVKAFIRGGRFSDFLWPHLTVAQQADMIETILQPFERA